MREVVFRIRSPLGRLSIPVHLDFLESRSLTEGLHEEWERLVQIRGNGDRPMVTIASNFGAIQRINLFGNVVLKRSDFDPPS